jgi:hypothetical protein
MLRRSRLSSAMIAEETLDFFDIALGEKTASLVDQGTGLLNKLAGSVV